MDHFIIGETGDVVLQTNFVIHLHIISFYQGTNEAKGTNIALHSDPEASRYLHLALQRFYIQGEVKFYPSQDTAGRIPCDPSQITIQSTVHFAVGASVPPAKHVHPEIVMEPLLLHSGTSPPGKWVCLQQGHVVPSLCQERSNSTSPNTGSDDYYLS